MHALENIYGKDPGCIEALANLAALRAHLAFTTRSKTEAEQERTTAKDLYDQITRMFATRVKRPGATTEGGETMVPPRIADVMRDPELYVDVARLAGESDVNRALKGYRESLLAREGNGLPVPAALLNNIGVLEWRKGELESAQDHIQRALTEGTADAEANDDDPQFREGVTISMLYNLGAVSEELGNLDQAKAVYERLLERHPEYVDGRFSIRREGLSVSD